MLTTEQIAHRRALIAAVMDSAGSTIFAVDFVKKDGTLRTMQVHLKAGRDLLAGESASESAKQGVETRALNNPNLRNVFDIGSHGWRSINLDTVRRVKLRGVETHFSVA